MSRSQQIIAVYEAMPHGRSPAHALRKAVGALTVGPPPAFVAINARNPFPYDRLGPPDWLVVTIPPDQAVPSDTGWRDVINAAPLPTKIVLMSYGAVANVPHRVGHHVDLAGWQASESDDRIDAAARVMIREMSLGYEADLEIDALRRGARVPVGDGTTMLNPRLLTDIGDLGLSAATLRILRNDNMIHLGDLVQHTEAELLRLPELGRKRLGEIIGVLAAMGLTLGAFLRDWPPNDMEAAIAAAFPAEVLSSAHQVPSGEMFRRLADRLVIDPAGGGRSDGEVGATGVSMQLQETVRRKLETLAPIAARLGNQTGWQDLGPLCDRLAALLDRPGADIPDVLGSLYGSALELGSFAEMDQAARGDPRSMVDVLDPSARRPLGDVLASLAPWLRRFPTVRDLDDEGGRFLFEQTTSQSARNAVRVAAETELIEAADAARLRALMDAGDRGGFVGGKAARRGILSVRNLVLTATSLIGGMLWNAAVNDYAPHSTIARRAGAMLVGAEDAVVDVISELPADVRAAVRRVTADARNGAYEAPSGKSEDPTSPTKPSGAKRGDR